MSSHRPSLTCTTQPMPSRISHRFISTLLIALVLPSLFFSVAAAQNDPSVVDPNLAVRTVISGLTTPINIAFLGSNDLLVLEKNTGQVKHVVNGAVQSTVLDLAVNNASERGLLGIALHPNFSSNHFVYLYWTCQDPPPAASNPFFPTQVECPNTPALGADTGNILAVPLLGNRVDRFVWNGSALTFDRNLIKLRAFQNDAGQPLRGNHNGGVIKFGFDRKLYI